MIYNLEGNKGKTFQIFKCISRGERIFVYCATNMEKTNKRHWYVQSLEEIADVQRPFEVDANPKNIETRGENHSSKRAVTTDTKSDG